MNNLLSNCDQNAPRFFDSVAIKFTARPSPALSLCLSFSCVVLELRQARKTGKIARTNDKADSKHRIIMAIKSSIAAFPRVPRWPPLENGDVALKLGTSIRGGDLTMQ